MGKVHQTMSAPLIGIYYQIEEEIGVGGMGIVYKGKDTRTNTPVAIKQLKTDVIESSPDLIERFRREGEALRELNHPNIVKMLEAVEEHGQHYLIMEYVSGGDLSALLQDVELPVTQILNITIDLADALTRAHRLAIIHRDLKPANILIGDDGTLRLTDFGVAHVGSKERVTDTNTMVGTIDYLPPEAFDGGAFDERGDIWAFGVILFEMLAGKRPFQGETILKVLQAITTEPTPDLESLRSDVPTNLIDLVYRMLEKDPQARIRSVRQVGLELEDVLMKRETTPNLDKKRFAESTPIAIDLPKHNLPAQTTPFVGRELELPEIIDLLGSADLRLLTIVAPGGMGKTRLAIEAANHALGQFNDGTYLVELAPLSDPKNIVVAIGEAIGYRFQGDGREPIQQILDLLHHKKILLVMDNYEHLLDGAGVVNEILKFAPDVKVMATSRQRLSQPGETVYHLTGMDFPDWETPEDAVAYAAVKLFQNSAKRALPGFEITLNNLDYIARICKLVQGMPLGIVLAASWLGMLTVEEVAYELQQGMDLLETDETELPERQRSIRAVMDYSWQQMTEIEQSVFMKLSIFKDGITREAAQEVAGANLRLLMSLVSKSLIRRDADSGRYTIHELLRQYAEEQLKRKGELQETKTHHAAYFSDWMRGRWDDLQGERILDAIAQTRNEFENIRAAWSHNVEYLEIKQLMKMQEHLWLYCHLANLYDDSVRFYADAAAALEKLPQKTDDDRFNQAILQSKQCMPLHLLGRFDEAQKLSNASKETLNEFNHLDGYLEFFRLWSVDGTNEILEAGKQAIAHFLEHDPTNMYVLDMYSAISRIAVYLQKLEEAQTLLNEGLSILEQSHIWSHAWYHLYSTYVHIPLEQYEEAVTELDIANALFLKMGDVMGIYYSNRLLSNVYSQLKKADHAIKHMAKCLQAALQFNLLRLVPETIQILCNLLAENDQNTLADSIYQTMLEDPDYHQRIIDAELEFVQAMSSIESNEPKKNVLTINTLLEQLISEQSLS